MANTHTHKQRERERESLAYVSSGIRIRIFEWNRSGNDDLATVTITINKCHHKLIEANKMEYDTKN